MLEEVEDVDNNWRNVVDVVDSLLEKTDICLDEYTGVTKRRDITNTNPEVSRVLKLRSDLMTNYFCQSSKSRSTKHTASLGNAFRTQNLVKPQLAFAVKPNNDDVSPWKPILNTKPHAIVPLEESLGIFENNYGQKQYDYTAFLPLLSLRPKRLSK